MPRTNHEPTDWCRPAPGRHAKREPEETMYHVCVAQTRSENGR